MNMFVYIAPCRIRSPHSNVFFSFNFVTMLGMSELTSLQYTAVKDNP